jgi:hypothetical protein
MLDIIGEFRAALAADPPEAVTYEVRDTDDDEHIQYWGA